MHHTFDTSHRTLGVGLRRRQMKTRTTVMAVAVLAVPLLTACPPPPPQRKPPPPTFAALTAYSPGLYPVSTDRTERFRIEPGLYMSERDRVLDDVNREDASGNIFAPPIADRVLIRVESTDLSVEVVTGKLVRWAKTVPEFRLNTLTNWLDGMYLTWTEIGPGTYTVESGFGEGPIREWARLKAINVEADTDILDTDFSDDGSPIAPLIIDATTPALRADAWVAGSY
jgi:hypothetical protein